MADEKCTDYTNLLLAYNLLSARGVVTKETIKRVEKLILDDLKTRTPQSDGSNRRRPDNKPGDS